MLGCNALIERFYSMHYWICNPRSLLAFVWVSLTAISLDESQDGQPTMNQLMDQEGNVASMLIIGQISSDCLAVSPCGTYQVQEVSRQRHQENLSLLK